MTKGYYKCECGREFDNPQSFNGHKSHCRIHACSCGKEDHYVKYSQEKAMKAAIQNKKHNYQKAVNKKMQWISEQHICEKCGKVMTEKYGSGRFCSRACANSRIISTESNESRKRTLSQKRNQINQKRKKTLEEKYNLFPKKCLKCGKILCYSERKNKFCQSCLLEETARRKQHDKPSIKLCPICGNEFEGWRKYCSRVCCSKGQSLTRKQLFKDGKIIHNNVRGKYHYGTYRDVYCDSSWELAFVLYLIDHDIKFERNHKITFKYILNGEEHLFIPDFLIDDTLYEIKGKKDEISEAKEKCVSENVKFKMLYAKDIKKYLNYAIKTYGKSFDHLYDRAKLSWLDHQND